MKNPTLLLLTVISCAFSTDISVSKDSLKIYNDGFSSRFDGIIIKNNSGDTISLDSAYLVFDVFDTTGMSKYLVNNRKLEAYWIEPTIGDFSWYLNEIGTNIYKLAKKYFSPNDKPIPVLCPPHDSCFFNDLRIGISLISEERPVYPETIKGYLELYFTNDEKIKIKIFSDDPVASIVPDICNNKRTNKSAHSPGYFTLNGKRITNFNNKTCKISPLKLIH